MVVKQVKNLKFIASFKNSIGHTCQLAAKNIQFLKGFTVLKHSWFESLKFSVNDANHFQVYECFTNLWWKSFNWRCLQHKRFDIVIGSDFSILIRQVFPAQVDFVGTFRNYCVRDTTCISVNVFVRGNFPGKIVELKSQILIFKFLLTSNEKKIHTVTKLELSTPLKQQKRIFSSRIFALMSFLNVKNVLMKFYSLFELYILFEKKPQWLTHITWEILSDFINIAWFTLIWKKIFIGFMKSVIDKIKIWLL